MSCEYTGLSLGLSLLMTSICVNCACKTLPETATTNRAEVFPSYCCPTSSLRLQRPHQQSSTTAAPTPLCAARPHAAPPTLAASLSLLSLLIHLLVFPLLFQLHLYLLRPFLLLLLHLLLFFFLVLLLYLFLLLFPSTSYSYFCFSSCTLYKLPFLLLILLIQPFVSSLLFSPILHLLPPVLKTLSPPLHSKPFAATLPAFSTPFFLPLRPSLPSPTPFSYSSVLLLSSS